MKKLIITESQYKRLLSEIEGIKGGINRVDKNFKKEFKGADVQNLEPNKSLMEDPFNVKDALKNPYVPGSKMKMKPEPEPMNEDIFNPELHKAIHEFIQNIWMNPSQRGLSTFFKENGLNWGDIASYLTSVGVLAAFGAGIYKVKNLFGTRFSSDEKKAEFQKRQDTEKITKMVEKNPKAPWNQGGKETPYEKKQRMQAKPQSGWEAKPKPFSPIKAGLGETEEDEYKLHKDYYDDVEKEPEELFKPVGMNKEIAILNGPDGMYILDLEIDNFSNMTIEDIADYVNLHMDRLQLGNGLKDFGKADLIKLDEKLREHLASLYSKNHEFVKLLNKLEEMSTGTAGNFGYIGPFSTGKPQVSPGYSPAEIINDEDEMYGKKAIKETDTSGTPQSGPTGQYIQPKIWAKNAANFKGADKTQWAGGSFVKFDPCTKLNNNKSAQKGKCSQGAVDNVVKLIKTKGNVNAPSLGESFIRKRPVREDLKLQYKKDEKRIIIVSDLEGKAATQETFKNKEIFKKNGFIWTGAYWWIPEDKLDIAKKTVSLVNKRDYILDKLEELEEYAGAEEGFLKAKITSYINDLSKIVDEATLSAEIRRYLTFFSKFHGYSFDNKLLIWIQNPKATRVASKSFWESKGRSVDMKKPIYIRVPVFKGEKPGKEDATDVDDSGLFGFSNKRMPSYYSTGKVYDIADTVAKDESGEIPEEPKWFGDSTPSETADILFKAVSDLAEDMGIKITQDAAKGGEKGYSAGDHINISSGVEGAGAVSTLVHEIAHEIMHHKKSSVYYQEGTTSQIREIQAESVSYAVLKHYGIPVAHHPTYLALWKATGDSIKKYLNVISVVTEFIIKEIDKEVSKISK